jgi:hypothetical protein
MCDCVYDRYCAVLLFKGESASSQLNLSRIQKEIRGRKQYTHIKYKTLP